MTFPGESGNDDLDGGPDSDVLSGGSRTTTWAVTDINADEGETDMP